MSQPGGGSLGALFVDVRPATSRFAPELSKDVTAAGNRAADAAGPGMGKRLAGHIGKALALGAGVVAVGLTKGLVGAVRQASDLNETMSKANVVFGKSGKEIQRWSNTTAKSLGLSKKAALDGATTFAIYGKSAGKSGKELVGFSTGLSGLASDMASFSNTSPEEAIQAIGAAMRGESDPIEKYGVLLNDAVLKNRAFKMGLIETTKQALTPQQRVLAVQAELFAQLGSKGSKAMGDFQRTSAGLANQQRIAKAQVTNLSAEIGNSLLPIAIKMATTFNTQVIPMLTRLWRDHGPQVVAWLSTAAQRFNTWASSITRADIQGWLNKARAAFVAAQPVVTRFFDNFKSGGKDGMADTIKVTGVAMGFLADHADLLGKALPYVVAGLVLYKTAQLASNIASVAAPFATILNAIANRRLAASYAELTIATRASNAATVTGTGAQGVATAATNVGTLARARHAIATGAMTVATKAWTLATTIGTTVMKAFRIVMATAFGPISLIIAIVAALAAGLVWLYKNNETARKVMDFCWKYIKVAVKAVGDWFVGTLWPSLKKAYAQLMDVVRFLVTVWRVQWNLARTILSTVWGAIKGTFNSVRTFIMVTLPNAFKTGVNFIKNYWSALKEAAAVPVRFVINTVFNGIGNIFNKIAGFLHLPDSIRFPKFSAGFAHGGLFNGRLPGRPSDVDNMVANGPGGRPIGLAGGEYVVNARQTSKHLPVLAAINSGMDGWADGGLIGFIKNPAGYFKDKVSATIDRIQAVTGDTMYGKVLSGMANKLRDGAITYAKSFLGTFFGGEGGGGAGRFGKWPSSPGAQRGDSGIWRGIVALIRSTGPVSGAFGNAYRPGDPKWHGSGRAVDWMGFNQDTLATILSRMNPLELIHRTNQRDYAYTRGKNKGSFNNGLMQAHRNHIHIAMALGGLFGKLRSFDTGGLWRSGTVGINTSGRTEVVASASTMDDVAALLGEMLVVLRQLAPDLASAFAGNVSRSIQVARGAGSPLKVRTA